MILHFITYLACVALGVVITVVAMLGAIGAGGRAWDRANRMVDEGLDLVSEDGRRANLQAGSLSNAQAAEIVRKVQG